MDINHSFMEVPDGVDETCVLRVFLFLTQITEEPSEVVMTVELGDRGIIFSVSDGSLTTLGDVYPILADGGPITDMSYVCWCYQMRIEAGGSSLELWQFLVDGIQTKSWLRHKNCMKLVRRRDKGHRMLLRGHQGDNRAHQRSLQGNRAQTSRRSCEQLTAHP